MLPSRKSDPSSTERASLSLPPIEPPRPPEPPSPPSVGIEISDPPARRRRGFFEELLQGRPEHLIQDSHEHPDAYDQETLEILKKLYDSQLSLEALSDVEKEKLDRATVEFFSATPRTRTPVNNRAGQELRGPPGLPPPEPVEGPVMDAFWWT